MPPILAIGAECRKSPSSTFVRSPILRRICSCCGRARSTGTCWRPHNLRSCGAIRRSRFLAVPTAVVAGIAFNTSHPPLDDAGVRRALAMSIDRDTISRKITLGFYPVTDMIQPRFSWAFDPSVREPHYDPAAADRLFDLAGWRRGSDGVRRRDGMPLQLTYVQFPETATGVRVATAVQAALRDRGIELTIKSVSSAQLFLPHSGVLATGTFDLAYVPWTMGADPDDSSVLGCGAPSNYMRWCDCARRASRTRGTGRNRDRGTKTALRADRAHRCARSSDSILVQCRLRVRISQTAARLCAERLRTDLECVPMELITAGISSSSVRTLDFRMSALLEAVS